MSEPFIGEIRMFASNFAPIGWALCDGQILSIAQNTALFSLLGTTYGGDGLTNFGLPDLRGRAPRHVGLGQAPGLDPVRLGERGGVPNVQLSSSNMPSHNHALAANARNETGGATDPGGNVLAETPEDSYLSGTTGTVHMGPDATNTAGGGQSFSVLNPYLGVNYIIALLGRYPSRD